MSTRDAPGSQANPPEFEYQRDFSSHFATMFDREGRSRKAEKVLAILADHFGQLDALRLLDVGCSTGFLTRFYGRAFGDVTGIDIDTAGVHYARAHNAAPNVRYLVRNALATELPEATFDVVTCTHIYEHVPDSARMLVEIHRVLRPGGVCFFSAMNRLSLIEPHYGLPLLSMLPAPVADRYARWTGYADRYYEKPLTVWGLRRLVADFEIIDYTVRVLERPDLFRAEDLVRHGSLLQRLALRVVRTAYWACPTYLWLLRKRTG